MTTRGARWERRRRAAVALRLLVLAAPLLAAAVAVQLVAAVVAVPRGSAALLWWAVLLVVASLVAWVADRGARRLLPLAALLELSLPFPGAAPSRWAVARRVATARARQELVSTARRWRRLAPAAETPAQAAQRVLPLALAVAADGRTAPGHLDRVVAATDLLSAELALPRDERDALRWAALVSPLGLLTARGGPVAADSARLAAGLLPWLGRHAGAVAHAADRHDGPAALPLGARVLAVATAFAELACRDADGRRPGRDEVLTALRARAGTTLDPSLVALLAVAPPAALAGAFAPWSRASAAGGVLGAARPTGASVPVAAAAVALTLTAVGIGTVRPPAPSLELPAGAAGDESLLDSPAGEAMGGFVGPRPARAVILGRGGAALLAGGGPSRVLPAADGTASPSPSAAPTPRPSAGSGQRAAPAQAPAPAPAAPRSGESAAPAPASAPPRPAEPAPEPAPADSAPPASSPEPGQSPAAGEPAAEPTATASPKPERGKRPKGEPTPTSSASPAPKR